MSRIRARANAVARVYNDYQVVYKGRVEYRDPQKNILARSSNRMFSSTVDVLSTQAKRALPYNLGRKYLLIQNKSAASIYFDFDQMATSDSPEIFTLGVYESISGQFLVSAIWLRGSAGTQRINVVEGY